MGLNWRVFVPSGGRNPVTINWWTNSSGLTERVSTVSYTKGGVTHLLGKPGVTGKFGITDGKVPGTVNDGHWHWVSRETSTGRPGFRDDLAGTGQRLGLQGQRFPGSHGAPHASVTALQKSSLATSKVVRAHADTFAATSKTADWATTLKVDAALKSQLSALSDNTVSLKSALRNIRGKATTSAGKAAERTARASLATAEQAMKTARSTGEAAVKATNHAAELSKNVATVAAEESAKVARATTEQAKKAAQVAAESAVKAARTAAEEAAKAARVAAETAAQAARVAAETGAQAAAAIAGAALGALG